ncbi:MAG: hypothetical protein ACLPID_02950 [Beijerinckiaceae bacterium]
MLALLATSSTEAACLDLPNKLLMFVRTGPSVQLVDLNQTSVAMIKLDCPLTANDWGKLALPLHVCTDANVPTPSGGQCKVIEFTPLSGPQPDGADFEYVIRRNLAN